MGKRRAYTPAFKAQAVLDLLTERQSLAEVCRERDLASSVVCRWRDQFLENCSQVFTTPHMDNEGRQRIADLQGIVGRLAMELDIARKVYSSAVSLRRRRGS